MKWGQGTTRYQRRGATKKCKICFPKEGPYRVLKVYDNGTVEITSEGVTKHVNMKRIIPLFETMISHNDKFPQIEQAPKGTKQFKKENASEDLPEESTTVQELSQGDTDGLRNVESNIYDDERTDQGQGQGQYQILTSSTVRRKNKKVSVENIGEGLESPKGIGISSRPPTSRRQ